MRHAAGAVRHLSPAYFALVMATGIVGVASEQTGYHRAAVGFLGLNLAQYAVLWALTLWRVARHPDAVWADMTAHQTAPGFFTSVAGTCVLGGQLILVAGAYELASILWAIGSALWITLTYTIFTALTVKEEKPSLDRGITGGWLLAVVATQSVATLSALLAQHLEQPHRLHLNFLALSMWLCGGMLYIWMISLIFYRYTFLPISPGDLTPPYWINMGAMAISTLVGARLIENAPDAWFLDSLLPFLKGFTVFYWSTGTWWIPMLVILAVWRHGYKRFPMAYDPLYWGAVFPLGMYTSATLEMSRAMRLDFLLPIPRAFILAALAAWGLTFAGMLRSLVRLLRAPG
jgi:tellurite resistance protein TehA-like permease